MQVRLRQLALARSGDKGASANIGVIARNHPIYEFLRRTLTPALVQQFFSHFSPGPVTRYELPNLLAFNFLLSNILGEGGGSVSLRSDAQGKALGQALLEMLVEVPDDQPLT